MSEKIKNYVKLYKNSRSKININGADFGVFDLELHQKQDDFHHSGGRRYITISLTPDEIEFADERSPNN